MLALQASRKKYANQFALKRWLRPGIVIWPTTVSADPGGMGAFAPAGGLGRGKFIGMYCADNWWRAPITTPYRGRNKYVMQVGDFRCGPRLKGISKRADTHRFPMMAVQEPPVEGNGKKSTANCRKPRASPCLPPLLCVVRSTVSLSICDRYSLAKLIDDGTIVLPPPHLLLCPPAALLKAARRRWQMAAALSQ